MSKGQLLTALSLQDASGNDVALIQEPSRKVTQVSGLIGVNVKEIVVARSGRRGSRSNTKYRDDSQIVLNGILNGITVDDTMAQYYAVTGALLDAIDTDRLLKWSTGSLTLQQNVRLSKLEAPMVVGPDIINYQATLRGSDPNAYSQTLQSASTTLLGMAGGFDFPFTFPYTFQAPSSAVAGFTNNGLVSTPPVISLFGYLRNPIVTLSQGVQLIIVGEIALGNVLTIDVNARTVTLQDGSNRRNMLDTGLSTWFELPRGSGTVTLTAAEYTVGIAGMQISWRDARD